MCRIGPAKVKASKSILLFTEGSPEVEIKLLEAPIKYVTSTLCLFTSDTRGLDIQQPTSIVGGDTYRVTT